MQRFPAPALRRGDQHTPQQQLHRCSAKPACCMHYAWAPASKHQADENKQSGYGNEQAWTAACGATHVPRLMLALVLPVLVRASLGACAAPDPSLWSRAMCMAAQAPLLQLLLLQALLLLGGFWASAVLPLHCSQSTAQVCCVAQP